MKNALRAFALIAAAVAAAPAVAHEQQPEIVVRLSPAQVAEVFRLIDLQPTYPAPPPEAYWAVQQAFREAVAATPGADRAVQLRAAK